MNKRVLMTIVMLAIASVAQAVIVETIDVANEGTQLDSMGNASAGEWFTVPEGSNCSWVAMNVDIGSATNSRPGYEDIYFRIRYDIDGVVKYITTSKSIDTFSGSNDWIKLTGLDLPPNDYYAAIFSNYADLRPYVHLRKEATPADPDYYSDGYAAKGWSGETAVGDRVDYEAEINFIGENKQSTIRTIDVPNEGTKRDYAGTDSAGEWITVPEGTTLSAVRMAVDIGTAIDNRPGYEDIYFRIKYYEGGNAKYITTTKRVDSFVGSVDWAELTDLDLPPNDYYVHVFSNYAGLRPYLYLIKELNPADPDYYSNGHAAKGWSGETAVGNRVDYEVKITLLYPQGTLIVIE